MHKSKSSREGNKEDILRNQDIALHTTTTTNTTMIMKYA